MPYALSIITRSLALVLDEFYATLRHVGVSAATGDGVEDFWEKVELAREDYKEEYLTDLRDRAEEREALDRARGRANMRRLKRDIEADARDEE